MKATPLSIDGSWKIEFKRFDDNRGFFYESFKEEDFKIHIGRDFKIKQTNTSSSSKGSVRGIHFAMVPPSQAKLVQCQRGSIKDYVIDIRVGSPTFGKFEVVELSESSASAVFIEEGLAHAFVALENQTVVSLQDLAAAIPRVAPVILSSSTKVNNAQALRPSFLTRAIHVLDGLYLSIPGRFNSTLDH
jgi:dTDP-4-dehydrorhamnose 3,5-epimerase